MHSFYCVVKWNIPFKETSVSYIADICKPGCEQLSNDTQRALYHFVFDSLASDGLPHPLDLSQVNPIGVSPQKNVCDYGRNHEPT